LVCFGPKRKGPNLLIDKFVKKEESFFRVLKSLFGEEEKEIMEQGSKAEKRAMEDIENMKKVELVVESN
jgi:hypothetical protein